MKKRRKKIIISVFAAVALLSVAFGIVMQSVKVDVCIDPGHGGDDPGAQYEGRSEKDDNLALALLVAEKLEERGVKVCLTRDEDKFISLAARCQAANFRRARFFVALHRNSAEGAHGVEYWVHSDAPSADKLLAQNICDMLALTEISENRGVKFGFARADGENYFINSHTNMPSCLAEIGFITDDEDNRLFDDNLDAYAEAIADGIAKTLNEI